MERASSALVTTQAKAQASSLGLRSLFSWTGPATLCSTNHAGIKIITTGMKATANTQMTATDAPLIRAFMGSSISMRQSHPIRSRTTVLCHATVRSNARREIRTASSRNRLVGARVGAPEDQSNVHGGAEDQASVARRSRQAGAIL